jgi:hypothetical protein
LTNMICSCSVELRNADIVDGGRRVNPGCLA